MVRSRGMNIFDLGFYRPPYRFFTTASSPPYVNSDAESPIRTYIYRKYGVYYMIYHMYIYIQTYIAEYYSIQTYTVLVKRPNIWTVRWWNIVATETPFEAAMRSSSRMTYTGWYFSSSTFIIHTHDIIHVYIIARDPSLLPFVFGREYIAKWFGHHIILDAYTHNIIQTLLVCHILIYYILYYNVIIYPHTFTYYYRSPKRINTKERPVNRDAAWSTPVRNRSCDRYNTITSAYFGVLSSSGVVL